jgi:hypothetical protein
MVRDVLAAGMRLEPTGRNPRHYTVIFAVHGPADLTWTEAAAALSTATGMPIKAQQITDDEQRAALRDAGMGEVAVEGIIGMSIGKREGFTPEQPRSVLTTTPSSLAGWAITRLRPALQPRGRAPYASPR